MILSVIINGALGRMGIEIAKIILIDKTMRLCGGIEHANHALLGKDYGSAIGCGESSSVVTADVTELDLNQAIIIDFSSITAHDALIEKISGSPVKLVVGTTGLKQNQIDRLTELSRSMPIVYSPNMSMGVNLLFWLTEQLSKKLNGKSFDIEIIEAHHRFKKDSPSGTARKLGEIAAASLGQTYDQAIRDGRSGIVGERTAHEIGMHAVRGGDIVGDHTVLFAGLGERIELRHIAHSRTVFAQGAVNAARWIADKKAGLYSMNDVLGLD